ncbi:MAG TPA: zinc ribbon domain-containing protein [Candidatus Acidoferrales bacterium]|nr:zinc ribbon domain-containing protein [Candidatus Acidoferrales bacterium]
MECPKCKAQNPDTEQFCRRCHMTLRYKCPACGVSQRHGGTCDACGVDFAKYALMMVANEKSRSERVHEQSRERGSLWRQVFLLPVTGGFSLIRYFLGRGRA